MSHFEAETIIFNLKLVSTDLDDYAMIKIQKQCQYGKQYHSNRSIIERNQLVC